jgi:hypothetical protein
MGLHRFSTIFHLFIILLLFRRCHDNRHTGCVKARTTCPTEYINQIDNHHPYVYRKWLESSQKVMIIATPVVSKPGRPARLRMNEYILKEENKKLNYVHRL